MDSYPAYSSFGFIKRFDHFRYPYSTKTPASSTLNVTILSLFVSIKGKIIPPILIFQYLLIIYQYLV